MNEITEHYLATWNSEGDDRARLLSEHWSPRVTYVDRFADQGLGTLAATAALAVVDACGSVRLASAGHPPPLIVRASGAIEVIDAGRRPVLGFGVGGGRDAIAVDVPFCEGDTLLMFSDGLVERRRAVIDEGIARLDDIVAELGELPVQPLCDQIVMRMREANFFVDATDFIFVALSGAGFPILVLPEAVRWISYLLPTTHALDLMRVAALDTPPLLPLAVEWMMLAVTSVALLLVGRATWLRTEHRLRVRGTLGQH